MLVLLEAPYPRGWVPPLHIARASKSGTVMKSLATSYASLSSRPTSVHSSLIMEISAGGQSTP
jgi:hypothetical protein